MVWATVTLGLAVRAFAVGLLGRQTAPRVMVLPYRVDINRASVADLQLLPGFGPARAESLVLERLRHGPFRALSDLERVDGIGPALVLAVRPFVSCGLDEAEVR